MQFDIGEITRNDDDLGFAKMFYREAAEKGDAEAQNNLGVTYERACDYEKALFWYKQSAEAGCLMAIVNLGKMYQYGRGTKVNCSEAAKYYQMAIDKNYDDGYSKMGDLYADGCFGEKDRLKAIHIWLDGTFNAKNGCFASAVQAGYAYECGLGVEQSYEKAKFLYEKSASCGNKVAHFNLGQIYHYGHGTKKDIEKAISHYLEAAKRGYTDAMYELGFIFYSKEDIERNNDVAMFWFTYGAQKGHLRCMLVSAEMWLTGEICSKNKRAAFNTLMDFLTTIETDDTSEFEDYKKMRTEIDDKDFWDTLDESYDEYCDKHNLPKLGGGSKFQA